MPGGSLVYLDRWYRQRSLMLPFAFAAAEDPLANATIQIFALGPNSFLPTGAYVGTGTTNSSGVASIAFTNTLGTNLEYVMVVTHGADKGVCYLSSMSQTCGAAEFTLGVLLNYAQASDSSLAPSQIT
jgi:hypothetical protein